MDPDAMAGVTADVRVGATLPGLFGLALGLLGTGAVLLAAGTALVVVAAVRARPHPTTVPPVPGPRARRPSGPADGSSLPHAPAPHVGAG